MNRPKTQARAGGHIGRGALVALVLHLNLVGPLVVAAFIYGAREAAQRAEEVDVGFESVPDSQLPEELPPLDDTPPPRNEAVADASRRLSPERKLDKKKKTDEARKPEPLAKETPPPPPEPEVVAPPMPPMPKPPAPPPQPKAHEKVVDLDNDKEVEPPPDAKYLAQKNNRAEVETRATATNLEREQKGKEASAKADNPRTDDKEEGDDKAKIADLEDVKSKLGRMAPDVTPRKEAEAAPNEAAPRAPKSPVLSLRDTTPRGHDLTPETADPSLPHDPAGALAEGRARIPLRDEDPDRHSEGKRVKLALAGKDYEYLFGSEAKADRQLAQKERSSHFGRRAKQAADRIRSALENFIPEVRPGNQTALNTRAAPFAAFIARMHRSIHKLWGFGVLEDWDEMPSSSPFNDESLVTTLEIVLNRDGTIAKVGLVRPSRYVAYDAAAIDVVYNAGPYPEPPREIRSGNGKIYIHWSFHRDGRQCATSGVDYYILNNAPSDGDETIEEDAPAPSAPRARAPAGAPEAGGRSGPRRLERNLPGAPSLDGPVSADGDGVPAAAPSSVESPASRATDAAARDVANQWVAAYGRGDVAAMVRAAGFPFRSTAGVAAKGAGDLERMLRALIAESSRRAASIVAVETAAGLRKMVGKLPPGLDDGSGAVFAVVRADSDTLVIVLSRSAHGPWKVTGLARL